MPAAVIKIDDDGPVQLDACLLLLMLLLLLRPLCG
jgi:hypothetical protein